MKKLVLLDDVISSSFLMENIHAKNLILLDASMASVGQKDFVIPTNGIAGARYIDWKKDFVDNGNSIPNMLPNEDAFTIAAEKMGINRDSAIVVYDQKGIYSSPRIWWMFKSMGHNNIAILNGGFPAWKNNSLPVGALSFGPFELGNFKSEHNNDLVMNQKEVFSILDDKSSCILDARSVGRFHGTSPEPRSELRSGHIPNSKSLPYSTLLNDGFFLPQNQIKQILKDLISNESNKIIFTCGSGITASILLLAASYAGFNNVSLYDGSWSEWGLPTKYPIEK